MSLDLRYLYPRLEPTSDSSVTVYNRPRTEPGAVIIGTVARGSRGVEAFRPHYSLAERSAARVTGTFASIGEGVVALIRDYEES